MAGAFISIQVDDEAAIAALTLLALIGVAALRMESGRARWQIDGYGLLPDGDASGYALEPRHYADQRISLDLDDGVRVNYGKFGDLLAEVKAVSEDKSSD